jgi:hypothetical protein
VIAILIFFGRIGATALAIGLVAEKGRANPNIFSTAMPVAPATGRDTLASVH